MSKQESWTTRYQMLRELGEGGNARVYLVKALIDRKNTLLKR